jgi:predicted ATPase
VPGYEVLDLLGRGARGEVYRARQISLNRPVALKLLSADWACDPVWLGRFRREALTASALNHPHICTIYDTGESAGRPFLSMELIEGQTLAALGSQHLPVGESARLIGQAARALAAAHAAGVVHRDVKPANLMVRGDGIVKVLDFGLARRLPDGGCGPGSRTTDAGNRVSTPLYMSPEQVRAEVVGAASDVFSLGVVLYELATGRHPFPADSEAGLLHAIVAQEPLPAARLNPEVPAALDTLILHMLAKDPRRRPTAGEVDAALAGLAGNRSGRPPSPTPRPGKPPTVGRQQERAALWAAFEEAAAGRGLLVCVTGEPGLGKTTLVEDFLEELAASGRLCSVGWGRCSERLAGAEAYLPFLEALESLLQGDSSGTAARLMKAVAPTWYIQVAPQVAGDPALTCPPAEAQAASQERLKREVSAFLQEVSRLGPVVLFLDDLHWADTSSADLLAYLGSRCVARRLLVVVTYRPSDLLLSGHPFRRVQLDLQGRGLSREVPLGFLGRTDVERYLALRFPDNDFPTELAAVIHCRTEGNPLFLTDLLQYLVDCGTIMAAAGRWALARALPDLQGDLPASVRSLIRRKIDQLGDADRLLLRAASVQGTEFDAAVIARALGRDAAEVEERLAELDRALAFVRPLREHELPDRTLTVRYAFVHAFYQNALFASLQPARKAALSAAVAQALVGAYGEQNPAVATELALLFEAARDLPRAADYFLQAVGQAVCVSANQEAIALARRGLGVLAALPETPARARQEVTLLTALGVALIATRGFASPEVEETYLQAQARCQRTDDAQALFPVLYGLWNVYLLRCEFERCQELADQVVRLAQGQPDPVAVLVAHNVQQQPLFHRGEFWAARRHQEQGLAGYDPHQHRSLTAVYGEDPGGGCLLYGALTLWHLGYAEQALQSARAARHIAEGLADPFNLARALYFGALTHLCRREASLARGLAEVLAHLCSEHGFALLSAGARILNGWGLTQQGEVEEGIRQMHHGLASWQATGSRSHRPYHQALLAEALGKQGRGQEGLAVLAEAQALSSATGERFYEAELHRLHGELLRTAAADGPGHPEAEARFRRALAVARRQDAKPLQLRALVSLCRLRLARAQGADDQQELAAVYGSFTEGFDTLDLQEAKALLAQSGE